MQGPDTDAQDQPPPFFHIRLATHGRSIQMGQTRKSALATAMSAFPPIATKLRTSREVRFVPEAHTNASFDHLTRTAKQRERDDNAQRLGWLLRPIMIMANSKEALPPDFTGVKAPA